LRCCFALVLGAALVHGASKTEIELRVQLATIQKQLEASIKESLR
jgi:hypothetical protein